MMEPITIAELWAIDAELATYRHPPALRSRRLARAQRERFEALAAELDLLDHTREGQSTLRTLREWDVDGAEVGLRTVAERMAVGPGGERRNFELDGLLRLAAKDPNIVLVIITGLRPALERIVVRSRAPQGDQDVVSELIALCCEQLKQRPKPVPQLLAELQRSLRRVVRRRASWDRREVPLEGDAVLVDSAPGPEDQVGDVLSQLVRRGIVAEGDAEGLLRTTVEGESLHDLAVELHLPYRTLQSRRLRAVGAVRSHLRLHDERWQR